MTAITPKLQEVLEGIAQLHLGIPTLTPRNSDRLDFHTVAVWNVTEALQAAYLLGQLNPPTKDVQ